MKNVFVTYMHSLAFTECENGHNLTLAQSRPGSRMYTGNCSECKVDYELLNNKIRSLKNSENTPVTQMQPKEQKTT